MPKKDDYEKFLEERNAAAFLRDDVNWLVGFTANDPDLRVINERLKKALKEHEENRCQDWL
tara:strand:- start:343 stop:525 length:183 start_codon:yes stop_codon:yes gene_type:complete